MKPPSRELPVQHEPGAGHHHHHLGQPHAEVGDGGGGGHQPVGLQLGAAILRVVGGEQAALVLLVGERLHHAHAAHVLLHPGVERAHLAKQRAEVLRHAVAITGGDHRHHGGDHRGQQRQLHVDEEHQRERPGERHDRDEKVFRAMMRHFTNVLQVLGDVGDQVARLAVVEERERELLQVVERPPAHLGLDVDAEVVAPIRHHRHQPGVEQVDGKQHRRGQQDDAPVAARQKLVDEAAHRHGEAQFEQPGDHCAAEIEREQAPIWLIVSEETLEHAHT